MFDEAVRQLSVLEGVFFENLIDPLLFQLGWIEYADDVYDGLGFALFGAVEIALAYVLFRPLELWRPVERWRDRRSVRTDVVYSLVAGLGIVPLMLFFILAPIAVLIDQHLVNSGYLALSLEQVFPALAGLPFVTLLIYVVIMDFAEYWRHRFQHSWSWWWALHSLHHDQRQMTLWSDDRNHVLDDVLAQVWRGTIALMIGVPPTDFPFVLIAFRLVEKLSHANTRLSFGRIGTILVNGPQLHRAHHALTHAAAPFARTHGRNFAVILPVWDILFRTWQPDPAFPATGVDDIPESASSASYLKHQWQGFQRLGGVLFRRWRLPPSVNAAE